MKISPYGRNCTERQKLVVVFTKVEGHVLQTLEHEREIDNVDMLFKHLKKTYGKDQRAIVSNFKKIKNRISRALLGASKK